MELLDTERTFQFDELFFSRTNHRGIILSGNSVFQRISDYDWPELLQKPHSLIRHPHMPRGVFYLFWDIINSGQPIGAYVKNLARNNEFYWVFALAIPLSTDPNCDIISIRLKPSSDFFNIVRQLYEKLLKIESDQKISPKQSCEILLEEVKKLGFPSYQSFMTEALMTEIESRQKI